MVVDSIIDIRVDMKDVCRHLGYRNNVEPSPRIASLLDEYIERAQQLAKPSYSYIVRNVEAVENRRVLVEGPVMLESDAIARLLERCDKVAIFILTIGSRLEEKGGWLADNELIADAYVLDAIGSCITEKLADYVHSRIKRASRGQGLCTSHRFSPGHCDWDIGQQRMLFHAMKGNMSGIYLTEDCLMVPQKSISGIIGIGPSKRGIERYNPCKTCDKQNCLWRRK